MFIHPLTGTLTLALVLEARRVATHLFFWSLDGRCEVVYDRLGRAGRCSILE